MVPDNNFVVALTRVEDAITIQQGYINAPETVSPQSQRDLIDLLKSALTLLQIHQRDVKEYEQLQKDKAILKKYITE